MTKQTATRTRCGDDPVHFGTAYDSGVRDYQADALASDRCACYHLGALDKAQADLRCSQREAQAALADQLGLTVKPGSTHCYKPACEQAFKVGDKVNRSLEGALYHAECFPNYQQASQGGYIVNLADSKQTRKTEPICSYPGHADRAAHAPCF